MAGHWNFDFCYKGILQKIGRLLKPLLPKFRCDLSVRLRDIAEKQVPAKLKSIVGGYVSKYHGGMAVGFKYTIHMGREIGFALKHQRK